jgi:tRNA-dihydrouridine synthase B
MIDINMGCPVKKVAKGRHAGAALMRDESAAARLIEATVGAVSVPVGLKMRTGWDASRRNAPRLARIAEACGISLITVHGRTREQGFGGKADWDFIARVKARVAIPVIANGDVTSYDDATEILRRSGADGIMVGRGACGRPWFPGAVARFLETGRRAPEPPMATRCEIALAHYRDLLSHHGREVGRRVARKHLGWYLDRAGAGEATRRAVQREDDPGRVMQLVRDAYERLAEREAA